MHRRMEQNYDALYPDCPVVEQSLSLWSKHAAFHSKPAFKWINNDCHAVKVLTYGELDSAASGISSWLLHREGLVQGDRVILMYPPGLDFVSLVFGCQRAGVVVIPLMPPNPKKQAILELQHIVSETKPVAILAPSSLVETVTTILIKDGIPSSVKLILLDVDEVTATGNGSSCSSIRRTGRDDLYLIQYTSGSTGPPKATMISAGAAAHNVRCARRAYSLHPGSVIASWLPQYHDCGLMFLLLTVICGATSVLASPFDFARRPWLWLEMISTFRATCTVVPGFALPLVVSKMPSCNAPSGHPLQLSQLECLILVNEPILESDVRAFLGALPGCGLSPRSIAPSYGLAENCTFVCTAWSDHDDNCYPVYDGVLPSGRVSEDSNMDLRVVDPQTLTELPRGREGEIWVSSPSSAAGYLGRSSSNLAAELAHHGSKFLRTGDTGVILENGFLFVTGRLSDVINAATVAPDAWIHPQHIERAAFRSSSSLRAGCCVALPAAAEEIVVVAELAAENAALEEVAERMRSAVKDEQGVSLSMVKFVPPRQVPKTTSGKLRRSHARRLLAQDAFRTIASVRFPIVAAASRL